VNNGLWTDIYTRLHLYPWNS